MLKFLHIKLQNILIFMLLPVACALTALSFFYNKNPEGALIASHQSEIDAYINDVKATIFNKTGSIELEITSPKMVHHPENNVTDIDNPLITIFRESASPWKVNSVSARAINGLNEIIFWNHVVINHAADKEHPKTTMRTNALTIFPEAQIAQTKDPIIILQPSAKIEAIGMLANLKEGTIKLLSQAREEYEPTT